MVYNNSYKESSIVVNIASCSLLITLIIIIVIKIDYIHSFTGKNMLNREEIII